ncbi:MAG: glutamyl-tRNA amidotransferase [Bacteroidetes bacterium HGW-Bacteroidetes-17]|jgi:hypothetical protein|nr:MAG: glutamyl-tRNA amidotransferase [Bacteroidetes bacterium HGW-Bacteroidetes-17]
MSLEEQVNADIKKAMLAKDSKTLEALRAVKASLLLVKTGKESKDGEVSKDAEISLLQRLVKQRKESAEIYLNQERKELAEVELFQVEVIQKYLPEQISEDVLGKIIEEIIQETGASSMKDMGKVMALTSQKLAGKAESKQIAAMVKSKLS